jgi:hypothetical protein
MQRSTRLAEVQMIGNCNRITKLSQFHGSLQTHRAIGARIPRPARITAHPEGTPKRALCPVWRQPDRNPKEQKILGSVSAYCEISL